MSKIKVVEVISSLNKRAGAEVFFTSLCVSLKRRNNIELTVIALYGGFNQSLLKKLTDAGIKVLTCNKRNKVDFFAAKRLKQILNSAQPDIINFHLGFYLTYFLAFGFKKRKWKLVKTYHSVTSQMNKLDHFLEYQFFKKGLLELVGISNIISNQIKKLYSKIEKSPFTIFNGVELPFENELLSIKEKTKKDEAYDFIIVASMIPVKNHIFLFDVFSEFIKSHAEAKLLCVGGGELLENNKRYCEEINMQNNVVFTGPVDDVFKYLVKSDTLILVSKYEGNPISILEGMSCGLQIIAPKVGGVPDIVKHNINGYLFDSENKTQFLELLNEAFLKKRQIDIKRNNLIKAKEYSIDNCASKYEIMFSSLLKKEI